MPRSSPQPGLFVGSAVSKPAPAIRVVSNWPVTVLMSLLMDSQGWRRGGHVSTLINISTCQVGRFGSAPRLLASLVGMVLRVADF